MISTDIKTDVKQEIKELDQKDTRGRFNAYKTPIRRW